MVIVFHNLVLLFMSFSHRKFKYERPILDITWDAKGGSGDEWCEKYCDLPSLSVELGEICARSNDSQGEESRDHRLRLRTACKSVLQFHVSVTLGKRERVSTTV